MDARHEQSTEASGGAEPEAPIGQRLFDRPFLLLLLGLLVMFLFYTGWGMYEVLTLPQGTLP